VCCGPHATASKGDGNAHAIKISNGNLDKLQHAVSTKEKASMAEVGKPQQIK
jgi:hypothetical protein